jgi:phosphate-selective porin OprO/OprP
LAELADRMRALETDNRQLREQLDDARAQAVTTDELTESKARLSQAIESIETRAPHADTPVPTYTEGMFTPYTVPTFPSSGISSPQPGRVGLDTTFGPGFLFSSDDDRFSLAIHYESQVDGRAWHESVQIPGNGGVVLPRQRIFFTGNITRPIEYEFAVNRGVDGNVNVLNAILNFHFDDRFQVRVGRAFTPFTYDQYSVSNYWLIAPERSVFTINLSPNRQFGVMAWGYLFDKRFDYAAGFFNGSRNSFENPNNNLDFGGYVNARPFQNANFWPAIQFLNMGASITAGEQDQQPVPRFFRIGVNSPNSAAPGSGNLPFLALDPSVREQGDRMHGAVHLANFHKGLSVIGEWQYGYGHYVDTAAGSPQVQVPFSGFYVGAAYLLTGEHVRRRARVTPLRSVSPSRKGDPRGIGAWELAARVAQLRIGDEVFQAGLSDPQIWSNSVYTTDLGVNWYLTEYVKIAMFWHRGTFGEPVQITPGRFQDTADMFWTRCQLYF